MITRFYGAQVYLGRSQWSNEIYVADGKVVAASTPDQEIDLTGNTLLPSFRDGHAHPLFAGRELLGLDVTEANTLDELGLLLQMYRLENPKLSWISGGSYNRALAGNKNREFLDKFVSDVPVTIHADDHHTLWVNSKALEVAGLLNPTVPKVSIGAIDLGIDGLPNGILRETEAIELVLKHQPKPALEQDKEAFAVAEARLISAGITSIQDAWVEANVLESYLTLHENLKLDYQLAILISPDNPERCFEVAKKAQAGFIGNRKVRVQAVKIFIDGVFGSATAAVTEPYVSTGQNGDLNWEKSALIRAISQAHRLGLQTHIHAIGDKATTFALDAIDSAETGPLPPVIAHAELTSQTLLKAIGARNITLCVQPYWAQLNDMLKSCIMHLGEERTNSLYAFRDMLDVGINLVFSSDWPVSSHKPIEGLAVAMHRRLFTQMPKHNPGQELSLEEALEAYSLNNLKMLGSTASGLREGDSFDAVVIEGNLKAKNLEDLAGSKILAVYKSGINLLP